MRAGLKKAIIVSAVAVGLFGVAFFVSPFGYDLVFPYKIKSAEAKVSPNGTSINVKASFNHALPDASSFVFMDDVGNEITTTNFSQISSEAYSSEYSISFPNKHVKTMSYRISGVFDSRYHGFDERTSEFCSFSIKPSSSISVAKVSSVDGYFENSSSEFKVFVALNNPTALKITALKATADGTQRKYAAGASKNALVEEKDGTFSFSVAETDEMKEKGSVGVSIDSVFYSSWSNDEELAVSASATIKERTRFLVSSLKAMKTLSEPFQGDSVVDSNPGNNDFAAFEMNVKSVYGDVPTAIGIKKTDTDGSEKEIVLLENGATSEGRWNLMTENDSVYSIVFTLPVAEGSTGTISVSPSFVRGSSFEETKKQTGAAVSSVVMPFFSDLSPSASAKKVEALALTVPSLSMSFSNLAQFYAASEITVNAKVSDGLGSFADAEKCVISSFDPSVKVVSPDFAAPKTTGEEKIVKITGFDYAIPFSSETRSVSFADACEYKIITSCSVDDISLNLSCRKGAVPAIFTKGTNLGTNNAIALKNVGIECKMSSSKGSMLSVQGTFGVTIGVSAQDVSGSGAVVSKDYQISGTIADFANGKSFPIGNAFDGEISNKLTNSVALEFSYSISKTNSIELTNENGKTDWAFPASPAEKSSFLVCNKDAAMGSFYSLALNGSALNNGASAQALPGDEITVSKKYPSGVTAEALSRSVEIPCDGSLPSDFTSSSAITVSKELFESDGSVPSAGLTLSDDSWSSVVVSSGLSETVSLPSAGQPSAGTVGPSVDVWTGKRVVKTDDGRTERTVFQDGITNVSFNSTLDASAVCSFFEKQSSPFYFEINKNIGGRNFIGISNGFRMNKTAAFDLGSLKCTEIQIGHAPRTDETLADGDLLAYVQKDTLTSAYDSDFSSAGEAKGYWSKAIGAITLRRENNFYDIDYSFACSKVFWEYAESESPSQSDLLMEGSSDGAGTVSAKDVSKSFFAAYLVPPSTEAMNNADLTLTYENGAKFLISNRGKGSPSIKRLDKTA